MMTAEEKTELAAIAERVLARHRERGDNPTPDEIAHEVAFEFACKSALGETFAEMAAKRRHPGALMTDEKQETAAIVELVMAELMRQLTPIFHKIADHQQSLAASVARLTATVEKMVTRLEEEVVRGNEHTDAIEQLIAAESRTMEFVQGLADQYGQIFNALSARIGALEAHECGLPEPPPAPRAN